VKNIKRIVVGISGASGVRLAKKFIEYLPSSIEKFVIVSDGAKEVFKREEQITLLDDQDLGAVCSSGSFKCEAMAIIPCSMNSLAKISYGIADNLLTRTAAVMIKEKRVLLIAPREMPFSQIALENMLKLSKLGVIIAPPISGYYAKIESLNDLENFFIGKWFDLLGIENNLYKRWEG